MIYFAFSAEDVRVSGRDAGTHRGAHRAEVCAHLLFGKRIFLNVFRKAPTPLLPQDPLQVRGGGGGTPSCPGTDRAAIFGLIEWQQRSCFPMLQNQCNNSNRNII